MSSGNFESTGIACRPARTSASTRSPSRTCTASRTRTAAAGRGAGSRAGARRNRRVPSGGRRACSSRARSFARSSICAAASSTLPRRSWILFVVCWAASSRRSTFVSSSQAPVHRLAEPGEPAVDLGVALVQLAGVLGRELAESRSERGLAGAQFPCEPDEPAGDGQDHERREGKCHGPTNAKERVGRHKNQPRQLRGAAGAECRIQRLRRATGSDGRKVAGREEAGQADQTQKVATCGFFSSTFEGLKSRSPPVRSSRGLCLATWRCALRQLRGWSLVAMAAVSVAVLLEPSRKRRRPKCRRTASRMRRARPAVGMGPRKALLLYRGGAIMTTGAAVKAIFWGTSWPSDVALGANGKVAGSTRSMGASAASPYLGTNTSTPTPRALRRAAVSYGGHAIDGSSAGSRDPGTSGVLAEVSKLDHQAGPKRVLPRLHGHPAGQRRVLRLAQLGHRRTAFPSSSASSSSWTATPGAIPATPRGCTARASLRSRT